jgi:hypothetical protein
VFKNVERIGRIKIAGNPTKSEPAALLGGDSKVLHGRRRQRKHEPEQQQKRTFLSANIQMVFSMATDA